MSGEIKAVVVPISSASEKPMRISEDPIAVNSEEKSVAEKRLAPSFDRLIEVNLALTSSVDRLIRVVKVSYVVLAATQIALLVAVAFAIWKR